MIRKRWGTCGATLVLLGACQRAPQAPSIPPLPPAPPAAQAPPKAVEAPRVEAEAKPPSELPAPPQVVASPTTTPPPSSSATRKRSAARKPAPAKRSAVEPKAAPDAKPGEPKPVEPKLAEEKSKDAAPIKEAVPADEPTPTVTEPAAPVLGEIITPEERNVSYRELEANVAEARSRLEEAVRRRPPVSEEDLTRIRSFIQQAQDLRTRDIRTALSLSRRAATLARELAPPSR